MKKILHTIVLVSLSFFAITALSTMHVVAEYDADDSYSGYTYATEAQWNNHDGPAYNGNEEIVSTSCVGCTGSTYSGYSYATEAQWNNHDGPAYNGNEEIVSTSCVGCDTGVQGGTVYGGGCVGCTSGSVSGTGGYTYIPGYTYSTGGVSSGVSLGTSYTPIITGGSGVTYGSYTYGNTGYSSYTYPSIGTQAVITQAVATQTICSDGSLPVNNSCNRTNTIPTTITTRCSDGSLPVNNSCNRTNTISTTINTRCSDGSLPINNSCDRTNTIPTTITTRCSDGSLPVNNSCVRVTTIPTIIYQSCWDGSQIPTSSVCPLQYKTCPNGTSIPVYQACVVTPTIVYSAPPVVRFNNVVTSVVTEVTKTSGRCNGIGLIANGAPSTGWFEYGETPNLGRTTSSANIGSASTAPFSNVLASLKPSTKYYCRAVMQNQHGLVKGEIVGFTTKSTVVTYVHPAPVQKPVKTTPKVQPKPTITCSDGSTVSLKSTTSATMINQGQKLVTATIEKIEGQLASGSTVLYKVTYKNLADTRVPDVRIQVILPQELTFVSATSGAYDEGTRTLTLTQNSLDPYTTGGIIITAVVKNDAPVGKTIITNMYGAYTVPGTQTQDEISAYVIGTITAATVLLPQDTGAKKVVGMSSGNGFMPNSLIEWLALLAILFIIFILGRSIYASYKDDEGAKHH